MLSAHQNAEIFVCILLVVEIDVNFTYFFQKYFSILDAFESKWILSSQPYLLLVMKMIFT